MAAIMVSPPALPPGRVFRRRLCPSLPRIAKVVTGAGAAVTSGNWPQRNTSGLENPRGVPTRISREPGSASGANVTSATTRSAMAMQAGEYT